MIDFRYHLVSIIAVFMALAVGIVLGSGPLEGTIEASLQGQATALRAEKDQLRERIGELQRTADYGEEFAEALAPALVANQLGGVEVVLVTVPGVLGELTEELRSMLELAGAVVPGTVAVQDSYLDPRERQVLDRVVSSLAPPGVELPSGATAYERAAAALAAAVVTDDDGAAGEPFPAGADVLAGLEELDIVEVDGEPAQRSTLALVVGTSGSDEAAEEQRDETPLLSLVDALDEAGRGAVLAVPEGSTADGQLLPLVRASAVTASGASSVDVADTTSGQVATVLALVEQLRGDSGHYGIGPGSDGALPQLSGDATS